MIEFVITGFSPLSQMRENGQKLARFCITIEIFDRDLISKPAMLSMSMGFSTSCPNDVF